ncbi:restriction endonuclease [Microbacterium sp. A84]|uniref:restriction endonuclease n=1 Tax=Microbacterium sp. A84 TaxID=3450715 RepID=UPI003F43046D
MPESSAVAPAEPKYTYAGTREYAAGELIEGKRKSVSPDSDAVMDHARASGRFAARSGLVREEAAAVLPGSFYQWTKDGVTAPGFAGCLPVLMIVAGIIWLLTLYIANPKSIGGDEYGVPVLLVVIGFVGVGIAMKVESKRFEPQRKELVARMVEAALQTFDTEATARGPRPTPQSYGVGHEGAERLAAEWMRHLGVLDAKVTRQSGDGGIDVTSTHYLAQVKNYAGNVAIESVRALHGVATAERKRSLFFTSGRMSVESVAFADRAGMALIHYDAVAGSISGLNDLGRAVCDSRSIPDVMPVL